MEVVDSGVVVVTVVPVELVVDSGVVVVTVVVVTVVPVVVVTVVVLTVVLRRTNILMSKELGDIKKSIKCNTHTWLLMLLLLW